MAHDSSGSYRFPTVPLDVQQVVKDPPVESKGRLKAGLLDLAETMQMLAASRRSGILYVSLEPGATVRVLVENGVIKAVKNSASTRSTAHALYKLGLIESSTFEGINLNTKKSLKQSWLERNVITPKQLNKAARYLATEELLDCMAAEAPEISFSPDEPASSAFDPSELLDTVDIGPLSLLMEAARREDEMEQLKDRLPDEADVLVPLPQAVGEEGLEAELMQLCDGNRTVEELCLEARATRNEVMRAVVDLLEDHKIVPLGPKELLEVFARNERSGHYIKALRVFERLEAQVEIGSEVAEMAARACELSGKSEEAARRYRELADVKKKSQEPNRAVAYLERAIRLRPQDMTAQRDLVLLFHEMRQLENLIKALWRMVDASKEAGADADQRWALEYLIKLDPKDERPLLMLADFFAGQDEPHKAVTYLEQLAERHCGNSELDKAVEVYSRILEVDNGHVTARLQRASLLTQKGEIERAITDYKRLEHDLKDTGVIGVSGDELIQMYSRLLKQQPNNAAVRDLLIDAQLEDSNPVAAWETLKPNLEDTEMAVKDGTFERLNKLFRMLPGDEVIGLSLARVGSWRGDRELQSKVMRQLAQSSLDRGRPSAAEGFLLKLLEDQPFDLEAHKGLADIHRSRGELSLAAQKLLDIAGICSRVARYDEARWHLESARKLDPLIPHLREEERELHRRAGR